MLESKYELADELSMNAKAQDASISAIRNDEEYACKNSVSANLENENLASVPSVSANLENAIKYSNHKGYGETCAKVILFGEHSVVYGHSAIALPLKNLRMRAVVTNCNESLVPVSCKSLSSASCESLASASRESLASASRESLASTTNLDSHITLSCLDFTGKLSEIPTRFNSIRTAIRASLEFAGWSGENLHIFTESDFPAERGLGSSAAAAGAIIRAILDYYGVSASDDEIFKLTQTAECVAHGRSSGLDATATAASWPVRFSRGCFDRMEINMRAWLVLADSGCKGMTRETVEALRSRLESNPVEVGAQLNKLGEIAAVAEDDLAFGRIENMGKQMTFAHRILADLGVSTAKLDTLVDAACKHGALGAKLTGGGGGGCVIALADSEDAAKRVSEAFKNAGACDTWIVNIGDSAIN
ncbi:mevalonate kinase [Gardnerella swidsinskii]|uniref:mevalonate kinase n=1 Tax=Gardnerella TaxID=2701 RepID=UPI00157207DE|nr:mevalonate kinase [Gardnerella vaginalis]